MANAMQSKPAPPSQQIAHSWDIFIAHASRDLVQAEELYELLLTRCRVFIDSRCLLPGDNWDTALRAAQRASSITAVLISAHTEDAYYESEEIATAVEMSRTPDARHRVVPVYLESVSADNIPYGLRRKQGLTLDAGRMDKIADKLIDLVTVATGAAVDLSPPPDSAELASVHRIGLRLSYEKLPRSRLAVRDLIEIARRGGPPVREAIIGKLKDFLLDLDETKWHVLPGQVRDLRKLVLAAIRSAAVGQLNRFFSRGEFEGVDLYGADFSSETLSGVSFRGCFLVEADFSGSNLTDASFAETCIRNANFSGANLSGTDFTGADWFNAAGFTAEQIYRARVDTLLDCPSDAEGMHRVLDSRYGLSFYEWPPSIQEQLVGIWSGYLRSGGLGETTRKRSAN